MHQAQVIHRTRPLLLYNVKLSEVDLASSEHLSVNETVGNLHITNPIATAEILHGNKIPPCEHAPPPQQPPLLVQAKASRASSSLFLLSHI